MAQIRYQTESLDDVVDYFRKAYNLPAGVVSSSEYYIDQTKNTVVFKFITQNGVEFDAIKAAPKPTEN